MNTEEGAVAPQATGEGEPITPTVEELQAKLTKSEELVGNYKIRAEKAEGKNKDVKPEAVETPTPTKEADLSPKDLYALSDAKVNIDDFDEVVKSSKLLGKSIQETLQDETVKGILKTRQEHRDTVVATDTGNARPSPKETTDTDVLEKASKGDFPEKGSDEAEQLFWARRGGKR